MNNRLTKIADWILADKFARTIADIGTDHGQLPFYLNKHNKNLKIFATDILSPLINKLKKKLSSESKIIPLLGFGLNPLQNIDLDICVIAGLGIQKMLKILKLDNFHQKKYIFQSIENPLEIREWVCKKGYFIENEIIIKEKKYFYHTLFVNKTKKCNIYCEKDIEFGPLLRKTNDKHFQEYWNKILDFQQNILLNISNKEKKNKIKIKIKNIETILKYD